MGGGRTIQTLINDIYLKKPRLQNYGSNHFEIHSCLQFHNKQTGRSILELVFKQTIIYLEVNGTAKALLEGKNIERKVYDFIEEKKHSKTRKPNIYKVGHSSRIRRFSV